MAAPTAFGSNASRKPRVRPGDLPSPIGVQVEDHLMPVGVAFASGSIGSAEDGNLEQAWRLVVRGEALDGRWALRGGAFVELAEDA
jgi:hypothetical protein